VTGAKRIQPRLPRIVESPESSVSGLIARVQPATPVIEATAAREEPSPSPREAELSAELATVRAELEALRSERDALAGRLETALAELEALEVPLTPTPLPEAPERDSAEALSVEALALAPPPLPAVPDVEARDVEARDVAAPPLPQVSSPGPIDSTEPSDLSLLRRLVVTPAEAERPSAAPGVERRTEARLPCEFEAEFVHDTQFFAGITQDISCGGVFVATYQRLPIGSCLVIGFELPDGTAIEARGEVRWIREDERGGERPGLGIAFTEISSDAVRKISEFCRGRPPLYIDM